MKKILTAMAICLFSVAFAQTTGVENGYNLGKTGSIAAYSDASATQFVISLGEASGVYTSEQVFPVSELDLAAPSFTITNLEPGKTYFAVIRAQNAAGIKSGKSNEVTFNTPGVPATPTDFKVDVTVIVNVNGVSFIPDPSASGGVIATTP